MTPCLAYHQACAQTVNKQAAGDLIAVLSLDKVGQSLKFLLHNLLNFLGLVVKTDIFLGFEPLMQPLRP